MTIETLSEHTCFGGVQGFYRHDSTAISLPMKFSVYRPPQALAAPVPVLFYLAGLTCSEETFMVKAHAQRAAARHGIMLVSPDTSPRDTGIADADRDWDFGHGAGFYLDAAREPWSQHFRMYDYVVNELRELIVDAFPARSDRIGIFGHSMGGHGALVLALRNPKIYRSVSAFAPVCAPMQCPWGTKAFSGYLGEDRKLWEPYDATALVEQGARTAGGAPILIHQGLSDRFLAEQLHPYLFEAACRAAGQPLTLHREAGYDHSYYFISTFIEDHISHHAQQLLAS